MSDFVIQKFLGLDTRRSEVTSAPGTLFKLENCHVNQGAEIEKRKEFLKGLLPNGRNFGLESVSAGLVVFGDQPLSAPTYQVSRSTNVGTLYFTHFPFGVQVGDLISVSGFSGGNSGLNTASATVISVDTGFGFITYNTATSGTIALNSAVGTVAYIGTLPFGATYQKLTAPPVSPPIQMTGVVSSSVYSDKCFVVASFTNGKNYVYYDGVLVNDFTAGLVLAGMTKADIAAELVSQANLSANYTGVVDPVTNTMFTISGKDGNSFYSIATVSPSTSSGVITQIQENVSSAGTAATGAAGSFQVVDGMAGASITQVSAGGNNLLVNAVVWSVSSSNTALLVATEINRNSPSTGYTAQSSGNTVNIVYGTTGTSGNGQALVVTVTNSSGAGVVTAYSFFSFVDNTGVATITITKLSYGGAGTSNLLGASSFAYGPAATYTTLPALMTALAASLNGAANAFIASADGPVLYVAHRVTSSSDSQANTSANQFFLAFTGGTDITITVNSLGSIAATASPTNVSGTLQGGQGATTQPTVITVGGGVPPYTYKWNALNAAGWSITTPTAASTKFSTQYAGLTGTFACTVKDSQGNTATSNTVTAKSYF